MLSCCLKCNKNAESKNPKVAKTNKEKLMLLSKFAVCIKSRFIKKKEASSLFSSLGLTTGLSIIHLLEDILF